MNAPTHPPDPPRYRPPQGVTAVAGRLAGTLGGGYRAGVMRRRDDPFWTDAPYGKLSLAIRLAVIGAVLILPIAVVTYVLVMLSRAPY